MNTPADGRFLKKLPRGKVYVEPSAVYRAVARNLRNGLSRRGSAVHWFEAEFGRRLGAKHAIAMPFARTSFYYLLKALNLPSGSEVILPPMNVADMVNMVLLNDLRPVFVDLAHRTGNIDTSKIKEQLTGRTRVILVTHLSGIPTEMEPIWELARQYNLVVFEDASQSIGAKYGEAYVGLLGDAGFFSISTMKPVSTFFGGMITTNDDDLAHRIRELIRTQSPTPILRFVYPIFRDLSADLMLKRPLYSLFTYYLVAAFDSFSPSRLHDLQRGNQNILRGDPPFVVRRNELPAAFDTAFTDFQGAVGSHLLTRLSSQTRRRASLGSRLLRLLQERRVPGLPHIPERARAIFWRFPIWVDEPPAFKRYLFKRYVDTTTTGLVCCSREPAFAEFNACTPQAFAFTEKMVYLPMYPDMDLDDIHHVAKSTGDYFSRVGI